MSVLKAPRRENRDVSFWLLLWDNSRDSFILRLIISFVQNRFSPNFFPNFDQKALVPINNTSIMELKENKKKEKEGEKEQAEEPQEAIILFF